MIHDLEQPSTWIALLALIAAIVAAALAYPPFHQARKEGEITEFRETRRRLVADRGPLVKAAASLYPTASFIPRSIYLTRPEWTMDRPVPLDRVFVRYHKQPRATPIDSHSKAIQRLLPRASLKNGLSTYSQVVGADPAIKPGLFWNGPSYDLRGMRYSDGHATVELGPTHYFNMFDVCEALAHEFAAGRHRGRRSLRREITDPTDLALRVVVPALAWLMVLKENDGSKTFLLHARDGAAVASDGELLQVFGGQLQPSSRHALDTTSEVTLWHSFVREFAEELLGVPEASGQSGGAISYSSPPFDRLKDLSDTGRLRVCLMGLGFDPLSNWPTFLCMAVIDRSLFGDTLPEITNSNEEGVVIGTRREDGKLHGFAFSEEVVEDLCANPSVGAATVACLRLAWKHREFLDD
jgi:hypothetical protein